MKGEYEDSRVFAGMMEAMVVMKDKDNHGVSLQNFKYAPEWAKLASTISITSPAAYRELLKELPASSV